MAVSLLAALCLVTLLTAALVAAFRFVSDDGGPHPALRSPDDEDWHPQLRSRPYSQD